MSEDKQDQKDIRAGALQSSLSILLHTHYAIRLWEGRLPGQKAGNVPRIMSMPQAIKRAGGIYRDSLADNPYADEAMWKVENAINAASEKVHALIGWLEQVLCAVPANITMTDVVSRSPLNIGVYSSSPLGYRCVWLLVGYDQMALKAFQASHFGLISRQKRDELLSHGGYLIRKIYGILRGYYAIPVTRQDLEEKTPAGEQAMARLGLPDAEIMNGQLRSSFSPPLKKKKNK